MIERLGELCAGLNLAMGAATAAELTADRLDAAHYRRQIENTLGPNRVDLINNYANALISGKAAFFEERYKDAILFFRLLSVMAQLGFSLKEFQSSMLRFAEELDNPDCERTPEGYAAVFGAFFPSVPKLDDGSGWMSLTNSTVQYASAQRFGQGGVMLVKRMHFVSFVGMFRADLFEGLCVGHGPKKCPICGRWFLTTDARRTKYCGGFAPGDARGRTCRQIGNLRGREQRELAADHPLKAIYERRMNTIGRQVLRGKLEASLAEKMKRLAKNKLLRAISDNAYAQSKYEQEMTQEALLTEAGKK